MEPTDLPRSAYEPLTPVAFLRRSAAVFPDRVAALAPNSHLLEAHTGPAQAGVVLSR